MLKDVIGAAVVATLVLGAGLTSLASAETAPPAVTKGASDIKRTVLQKFDVPGAPYETVIALVEIVPNGVIGKHTHFGIDSGVVQSGVVALTVAGGTEQVFKVGGSWQIPPNTVHGGKAGPEGARIINTYVVEKGKPLATPAP